MKNLIVGLMLLSFMSCASAPRKPASDPAQARLELDTDRQETSQMIGLSIGGIFAALLTALCTGGLSRATEVAAGQRK